MSWTLQTLIDGKMTVAVFCHNPACNHNATLDLEKLRDRFGSDMPAMNEDLIDRLVCKACGGKRIGLTYTPSGNERMAPVNRYAKAKGL